MVTNRKLNYLPSHQWSLFSLKYFKASWNIQLLLCIYFLIYHLSRKVAVETEKLLLMDANCRKILQHFQYIRNCSQVDMIKKLHEVHSLISLQIKVNTWEKLAYLNGWLVNG